MTNPNFTAILQNAKLGEIEKPKPLPAGSYAALVKSIEQVETKGEKQTGYIRVNMEIVAPLGDVNEVDLEEFGNPSGKKIRTDFYITDDAIYRLQDFILEHIGLDMAGMSLEQAIPQMVNNQVGVKITQEISKKDPSVIYAVVSSTFNLNAE